MTSQELKETYQLNFTNSIIDLKGFPSEILNRPYTFNNSLSDFLFEWSRPRILTSELLPEFENVLNGNNESFYTNGQFVSIDSTNSTTEIHDEEAATNPVATLPTQDFYDILVLWRDFLLEPPLNGTKVDENGSPRS
jgi:hypothetical protein